MKPVEFNPIISIIMPAYNAESFIAGSIESVINQTYRNWELLIINDGSTDRTQTIAENYSEKDNRIKVINQPNKRLGGARNTGIKNSSGEWIAFLDSDDLWASNKLQRQLEEAFRHSGASVIYSNGYIFNGDNLKDLVTYPTKSGSFSANDMYQMEYQANYIPVLAVLVKKELVDRIGYQEERIFFYGCEDWDFWLRAAKLNAVFLGLEDYLFFYRRHGANMSSNSIQMRIAQAAVWIKNYSEETLNQEIKRKAFNEFVPLVIKESFEQGKDEAALYLLKEMSNVYPLIYNSVTLYAFRIFKQRIFVLRFVMRKILRWM